MSITHSIPVVQLGLQMNYIAEFESAKWLLLKHKLLHQVSMLVRSAKGKRLVAIFGKKK